MKIYDDHIHRIAYATDASAYRQMPLGVAYPKTEEEIIELLAEARRRKTYLIPRAGGTSIAGQVVGSGIVMDVSRYMNKILEVNVEERWAWVEPGVVRDELNLALKPYGLYFSPETSTSNRCCLGGMLGNNSCGTHSLVCGSTRDHVMEVRGILSDGSRFDSKNREGGALLKNIYAQLEQWGSDASVRELLKENFPDPSLRRRSCGYAIDEAIGLTPAPDYGCVNCHPADEGQPYSIDICKLLAGSEGTLAIVTAIKVSLDPVPPKEKMVLCAHCDSLPKSYKANLVSLKHSPVAIELMDGKLLELCRNNHTQDRNRFFVKGEPAALLISEFNGPDMDRQADALEQELKEQGLAYECSRVYGDDISRVWALRKAGLGVLTSVKGDRKPIGVIEDTAVAPERLPQYLEEFEEMMQRLGLSCVYYGHISTGELHLRPILDVKDPADRKMFRRVAEESARLVRKHRGSLSGEHGDGRLRGEFIPIMYGQEVYSMMRQVKKCWDPDGVLNMHKIVDAPPMDEELRYEENQKYCFSDVDLVHAIEQCNGAGDCRKSNLIGGTMCPAYKVSGDELMTTRARANVIREVLTRGLPDGSESHEEVEKMLYDCLACKGCRGECPSNVDMTYVRSHLLQAYYDQYGVPLRSWMVARMAQVERLGMTIRPLYNMMASWNLSSAIIKRIVNFAPQRAIPTLSKRSMVSQVRKLARTLPSGQGRRVYLFADEFTNYQEAELGVKFAQLLGCLGYEVIVPKHVESGRAAISKGCLHLASRFAEKNVSLLADLVSDDAPLVGIEPSCILSFRDEYPELVSESLKRRAQELASHALLYDEFIMREVARGHITAEQFAAPEMTVWLHGHCHQKALVGVDKTVAMLRLIPGCKVNVIPSGCCGMAGSFGYEKEHYKTSLAIGEMVLFPTVRKAVAESDAQPMMVAAPGTSCRQQILDGTGVRAVHPIEIMLKFCNNKAR